MLSEYFVRITIGYSLLVTAVVLSNWYALVGGVVIVLIHLVHQMATLLQPKIVHMVHDEEMEQELQSVINKIEQLEFKVSTKR